MSVNNKTIDKILDRIAAFVERFIPRIVVVRKGFEENVLLEGFHTVRFHTFLSQPIVLLGDSESNKQKVEKTSRKLNRECRKLVARDIEEFRKEAEAEMSSRKKNKKKKKKGGKS